MPLGGPVRTLAKAGPQLIEGLGDKTRALSSLAWVSCA